MSKRQGIYVEIFMHVPMDALWEHTQVPALHQQWDLRFTSITFLPRGRESDPQLFRYATRILPGVQIVGEGETIVARTLPDGSRTSSLKFRSASRLSLIREGRGYWKYIPTEGGIRFLTWYDYEPRWGALGRVIDALLFRPLMGWATAWSFDRLRLWLERGILPEASMRNARRHVMSFGLLSRADDVPRAACCVRTPPVAPQ